MKTEDQDTKER